MAKHRILISLATLALVAPLALTNVNPTHASVGIQTEGKRTVPTKNVPKHKKVMTMKQFRAMLKKQQKASIAKEKKQMKGAKTIFLIKGHEVYTIRAKGRRVFPISMKKYASTKKFHKIYRRAMKHLRINVKKYRLTHKAKYLRRAKHEMRYEETARLPKVKAPKKSVRKPAKAKTFVVNNHGRKQVELTSLYKRGSYKLAKRSGFAKGPTLDKVRTMFDRYKPNDKRAVIPAKYNILPNNTAWLVSHHTNNVNTIANLKNAYFYSPTYHGWTWIGKPQVQANQSKQTTKKTTLNKAINNNK